MGVTQVIPLYHRARQVQLPRRNTGVECRAVGRFGHGACPKIPHILECGRVPKRHTDFAFATLATIPNFASPIPVAAIPILCFQLEGEV
jgi:hypothetical protein